MRLLAADVAAAKLDGWLTTRDEKDEDESPSILFRLCGGNVDAMSAVLDVL